MSNASQPSPLLPTGGSSSQGLTKPASSAHRALVANTIVLRASTSFPEVGGLGDDNWLAWKTRITTVLKRDDAYEIATGAVPQPQDPVAAATWAEKDLFARLRIVTSIKDEQIVHILGCNSSAEMWDALRTIHEPRGEQSIIPTKRALYSAQAEEGSDIAAHLNNMTVLRERLTLSGHWIDEDEFKALLLTSLPPSWDAFTTPLLIDLGYYS